MGKKVSKYLVKSLTIAFFLLAFYILIFGSIARKNNQLLSIFGYSYSSVPTNSMSGDNSDSFDAGSFIISKKVKFENIKVGDIIIFQDKNILVVHRVVDINDDGSLVTKGDNNDSIDANFVTKNNYQAKVIKSFMIGSLGKNLSGYQLQILFILIIVLIIFLIYQFFILIKEINENKLRKIKQEQQLKLEEEIKNEINKEWFYDKQTV